MLTASWVGAQTVKVVGMCCQITAQRDRDHHRGNKSLYYTLLQICRSSAGKRITQEPKHRLWKTALNTVLCITPGSNAKHRGMCYTKSHNQVRVVVCEIAAEHCKKRRSWISGALKSVLIIFWTLWTKTQQVPFKNDSIKRQSYILFVYLCASVWNARSKAACNSVCACVFA